MVVDNSQVYMEYTSSKMLNGGVVEIKYAQKNFYNTKYNCSICKRVTVETII